MVELRKKIVDFKRARTEEEVPEEETDEMFKKIENALTDLNDKLDRFDGLLSNTKEEIDKLKRSMADIEEDALKVEKLEERLNLMEDNIRELLSVYEIITNELNPFIESERR